MAMWLLLPSCQVEKVLGANVTVLDDVGALIKSCHYFKRERSFNLSVVLKQEKNISEVYFN